MNTISVAYCAYTRKVTHQSIAVVKEHFRKYEDDAGKTYSVQEFVDTDEWVSIGQ